MELAFVAPRLVSAPVGTVPSLPWRRVTKADSQIELGSATLATAATACALSAKANRRWLRKSRRHSVRVRRCAVEELRKMVHLGGTPAEKALAVNLDDKFYGSFAEIGAGQEVSRTFLQAGAAAGTVARSISAYDMKMSDVNYGQAKRYVTRERLEQMLNTEYDLVEKTLRKQRGDDACFFAFATTVAAKAYNSDRECEGWVGLTYQSKPGEERSTVILHIRMSQPTAQLQGEAIGVDYVDFKGPPFQSVDPRLLAFRLIQLRIANGVILQPDSNGNYKMAVPNNFLYKCPVIVERSRFKPVTFMHTEVLEATERKLRIDDLTVPVSWQETKVRLDRMKEIYAADTYRDGKLSMEEFTALVDGSLSQDFLWVNCISGNHCA
eukprot:g17145.t1